MVAWLSGIVGGAIAAALAAWLAGFLDEYLPPPARAQLAITNFLSKPTQRHEDRLRIVLCWLKNDRGKDGETVARAFTGVHGIDLVRSARLVAAGGAGDDWIPAMREKARRALSAWHADLAIVGLVKKSDESLSLWFVRRSGEDTLRHADQVTYTLTDVTLGADFHEDLNAQLVATALEAVTPLATAEALGQALEKMLRDAATKVENLLNVPEITEPLRRAKLYQALGTVLQSLGEFRRDSDQLAQAIRSYNKGLAILNREKQPVAWADIQIRLGGALTALGGRTRNRELLIQAVSARNAALTVYTREYMPIDWAHAQNNLGNSFHALGDIEFNILGNAEQGAERLAHAITAHNAALSVFTRERWPLEWANVQNSLGVAQEIVGKLQDDTILLGKAVNAYKSALGVFTREKSPLEWALTQNNIARVLQIIGTQEGDAVLLEEAVVAYNATLEVRTRNRSPRDWAAIQVNLGNTLQILGEMQDDLLRVEEAISAYKAALTVFERRHFPERWADTNHNLDRALEVTAELRSRGP